MEVSFNELRQKEVVNLHCGKRMGRIIDIVISTVNNKVLGLVVPGEHKMFRKQEDIFIPWKNVEKIGDDVILVALDVENCTNVIKNTDKQLECGIVDASDDYIVD
ncbi:MAG: YlmC/YmxH family sporulation protein [Corallococcus sp.]|nr:YlmC/YmxH family sporulation protein [Corallococcus sp.]